MKNSSASSRGSTRRPSPRSSRSSSGHASRSSSTDSASSSGVGRRAALARHRRQRDRVGRLRAPVGGSSTSSTTSESSPRLSATARISAMTWLASLGRQHRDLAGRSTRRPARLGDRLRDRCRRAGTSSAPCPIRSRVSSCSSVEIERVDERRARPPRRARGSHRPTRPAISPNGLSSTLMSTIVAPARAASVTTCHGRLVCAEVPATTSSAALGGEPAHGIEEEPRLVVALVEPQHVRACHPATARAHAAAPRAAAVDRLALAERRDGVGDRPAVERCSRRAQRIRSMSPWIANVRAVGAAGAAVQAVDVLGDEREPVAERGVASRTSAACAGVGLGARGTRRGGTGTRPTRPTASRVNASWVASSCGWYSRAPTVQ